MALLQWSKRNGGLGLPNVLQYYQVIALRHLLDCKFHATSKLWVSLEKTIAGRNLSYAPWVPTGDRHLSEWVLLLTTHSLNIWDKLNISLDQAPPTSPLAPVGGFPWFTPGERLSSLGFWARDGIVSLARFVATPQFHWTPSGRDMGVFPSTSGGTASW